MPRRLTRVELEACLDSAVRLWAAKSIAELRPELTQVACYMARAGDLEYQADVQLLEDTDEYLDVSVSVDDAVSLWRQIVLLARSFLVYSDGRVDV